MLPLLLSAGETGREILYPVATVVIGGLLTSTFFEFLLRQAVFWSVGRGVAERIVAKSRAAETARGPHAPVSWARWWAARESASSWGKTTSAWAGS